MKQPPSQMQLATLPMGKRVLEGLERTIMPDPKVAHVTYTNNSSARTGCMAPTNQNEDKKKKKKTRTCNLEGKELEIAGEQKQ